MNEYVNRETAIRALLNDAPEQVGYSREDAADCIRYIDSADVAPVRHGRWNADETCSCCGEKSTEGLDAEKWNYWFPDFCPNCGAKMDLDG